MRDLTTALDNILLDEYDKLPKDLKAIRYQLHTKFDLPYTNEDSKLTKNEALLLLDWLLDNPVKNSDELAKFVVELYINHEKF